MKRMNKAGQQMTLGTIIAIVLGIAVLVLLIFGFSQGWTNLWDRVTAFGGGDVNVDTIVKACALKCSSGDTDGFCSQERTVNFGEKIDIGEDCKAMAEGGDKLTSCKNTCENLAEEDTLRIKVASCPSITC